uniref:Ig-like domain-containing protein n=1 Tax=Haplochromis burtoni TaxID=8153 RepID=A0A3Q2VR52_HAPBU
MNMNFDAFNLFALLFLLSDQKNIKAVPGQTVTLPCQAPKHRHIIVVEWSRRDLDTEYVLLYRDEQFDPENQHPSFKNRVDLQDRQMKDGDVSLILKDVMTADTGTYECRVFQTETNHGRRVYLKTGPIIINLSVVLPGQSVISGKTANTRPEQGKSTGILSLWMTSQWKM